MSPAGAARPRAIDVVRARERDAGDERLERRALRRLARDGERARSSGRGTQPSSATMPGLPVALRAYLIAASFASAPELQKNACAPPNRSESSSASRGIGSVQ